MNGRCPFYLGIGLSLLLTGGLICCRADADPDRRAVVGGPCQYKSYPGEAAIVSVEKKADQQETNSSGESRDRYEVRFIFHTDQTVAEPYAGVEGKIRRLRLKNGSDPGLGFVQKYGIEVGRTFPCHLKVITRGTCTPVLFDFPTIDLGDYSMQ
ncbi:MAG: hypothetical protein R6U38_13745 [Desulfatiglandaceae bacterium]